MTLGVGIVGCGFIGAFHARAVQTLSERGVVDARVTACCDLDGDRAATLAGWAGTGRRRTRHCSDVDALIEGPDVDVVYVCTPTVSHPGLVAAAAEAGRAVFCEKPLAFDGDAAQAMAKSVAPVPSQVGLVLRYSPTFRFVRRRLSAGDGGPLMNVVLRDDQFFPVGRHYGSAWRSDARVAGAGTLLEHSVHDIDLLRWWGGPIAAVTATTRNVAGHEGIEDSGVVTVEFESGALASLTSVWHEILSRGSLRHVEVFSRDELLSTRHDMYGPVTVARNEGETAHDADDLVEALLDEIGFPAAHRSGDVAYVLEDWAFLRAVEDGRSPEPGFGEAVRAHRVLDAVYESAATKRRIDTSAYG